MSTYLATLVSSKDGQVKFSDLGKAAAAAELENILTGLCLGAHTGSIDIQKDPAYAVGILELSGSSGAVGGTIGGRLVTAAFAVSDANSADLIAAAILADATADDFVTATSRCAKGTITIAGGAGVVTATLTVPGQAPVTVSVTWATSDTATATALAAAINAAAKMPVVASSSAGVVTVYAVPGGAAGNSIQLAATGTGVTASGAVLTNGGTNANVVIKALLPGTIGNGITLAASGTGVTAPTGARLVGGLGAPGNAFTV